MALLDSLNGSMVDGFQPNPTDESTTPVVARVFEWVKAQPIGTKFVSADVVRAISPNGSLQSVSASLWNIRQLGLISHVGTRGHAFVFGKTAAVPNGTWEDVRMRYSPPRKKRTVKKRTVEKAPPARPLPDPDTQTIASFISDLVDKARADALRVATTAELMAEVNRRLLEAQKKPA